MLPKKVIPKKIFAVGHTSHRQGDKMASALPADSRENLQLSQRNDGPEPTTIATHEKPQYKQTRKRICITADKNIRLLIKENVFLDLFVMVFEEHN